MIIKEDLISIIIPVYNAEKYLERCVNSIINQTYKNFEAIFINDGSTDSSLELLRHFQCRDKRLKIIDKKNNGVGAARNDGIIFSKGKYITFLDSDDWYEKNFLEELYKNLMENNSDISICNPRIRYKNQGMIDNINLYSFEKIDLEKEPKKILKILEMPVVWNKLYKKEIIIKNKIEFPDYSFAEDVEFLYKVFLNIKKVSKIEKYLYNYYKNDQSLTTKVNRDIKLLYKMYLVLENIENYTKENYIERIDIFYQYKIQFIFSITRYFKDREINLKNKEMLRNVDKKLLLQNKKILIYYIIIRLGKCFEFAKILEKVKRR